MFSETQTYVWQVMKDRGGNYWVANPDDVGVMQREPDGSYTWNTGIASMIDGLFRSFYADENNITWIGTSRGLVRFDGSVDKDYAAPYKTLIRKVTAGKDTLLYDGGLTQPQNGLPELAYGDNTLAFEYAAAYFEVPKDTRYRYKLVGFDREWSDWVRSTHKEYTNLPEGRYVFRVKARNTYGTESQEAHFTFIINPPWYRSSSAFVGYFAAFLVLFFVGFRIFAWRLIASRKKLQRIVSEKTAEVVQQRDKIEKVNKALWGEMQLAKKIQTVLLPKRPQIPGYTIAVYTEPAEEVGGDYYDVLTVKDTHWVVIGDVSGHGVPAGLVMMMVQTAIQTALDICDTAAPADILTHVNRTIHTNVRKLGEEKYMTITILSTQGSGEFYFSGLHQDILVYRSKEQKVIRVETNGIWIGITEEIGGILEMNRLDLHPGDAMLLFTDGITEATDTAQRMFSGEKLASVFKTHGSQTVDDIRNGILTALEGYTSDDDITFLVLKRSD